VATDGDVPSRLVDLAARGSLPRPGSAGHRCSPAPSFRIVRAQPCPPQATSTPGSAALPLPQFPLGQPRRTDCQPGEFGIVFVLPLYLQSVLGYSAFQTGLVLVATALGAFFGGPAAANFAQRFGARQVVRAGMLLEAVGLLAIIPVLDPTTTGWRIAPALFVYGLGVGLATAQLTSVILAEVPTAQSGQASGTQSTTRQVGAALGIAILGTVLSAGLGSGTESRLSALPGFPVEQATQLAKATKQSAGQILVQLRAQPGTEAIVRAIEDAFTTAAHRTALVAAAFIMIGFVASWLIPDIRPGQEDEAAERVATHAKAQAAPPASNPS